jgi:hypothetical protein
MTALMAHYESDSTKNNFFKKSSETYLNFFVKEGRSEGRSDDEMKKDIEDLKSALPRLSKNELRDYGTQCLINLKEKNNIDNVEDKKIKTLPYSVCYVEQEKFHKLNLSSCDEKGFNEALSLLEKDSDYYLIWQFKNDHEIAVTSIFSGSDYAEKTLHNSSIPYKKDKNIIYKEMKNGCFLKEQIIFEDKKILKIKTLESYGTCDYKQQVVLGSMKGMLSTFIKVF